MKQNPYLSAEYQEKIYNKWKGVIDAGGSITDHYKAINTALVLENTKQFYNNKSAMNESFTGALNSTGGMGAGPGTNGVPNGGGPLGSNHDFTNYTNDMRMPQILIPTVRRIFPELLAHNVVGVQPMNGPVGFAFALRLMYGNHRQGVAGDTSVAGDEMGYNTIYSDFTGASGMSADDVTALYSQNAAPKNPGLGALTPAANANTYWQAFTGGNTGRDGMGASLGSSEWWKIGEDMPMASLGLEKGIVEAKTRKLGAHWSLEMGEDMMHTQGVDVETEMVNLMSYEIQTEIDRQLIAEMVKSALNGSAGSHFSTWSPVSADARHQAERIGTLYTQLLVNAHKVAVNSRRGPANFAIASTTVCALLERVGDFTMDSEGDRVQTIKAATGITKAGTIRHGAINLYRDTFGGDYVLLGYKGQTPYDTGIVYCPYIPVQLMNAVGTQDFSPRMGVRTRYGVLNHLLGSSNYYHFMKVDGLSNSLLAADGGRVFLY